MTTSFYEESRKSVNETPDMGGSVSISGEAVLATKALSLRSRTKRGFISLRVFVYLWPEGCVATGSTQLQTNTTRSDRVKLIREQIAMARRLAALGLSFKKPANANIRTRLATIDIAPLVKLNRKSISAQRG